METQIEEIQTLIIKIMIQAQRSHLILDHLAMLNRY